MAERGNPMHQENFHCSICLKLLNDPVTPSCGHSYCTNCIKRHWDTEEGRGYYSCPQCRQRFIPRPVLSKNIMLAELVDELQQTANLTGPAPAEHCYAGPEDVACDVCVGRKLKAQKSCLSCSASYCEKHLQPHNDSAPFKKHKLVEPCEKLQEKMCPLHDEVMKMFCRTDQQCICHLCSHEDHKEHKVVTAKVEFTEKKEELDVRQQNIQQGIQDREGDVRLLQQELDALGRSADGAVEHSENIFTKLIGVLQKRSSEVTQQIRTQQETEERRVKELQEKLEREIKDLKGKNAKVVKLANTQDHTRFLQDYPSLSTPVLSTHPSCATARPLKHFEDLKAAVSQVRSQIQDNLTDTRANISWAVANVDVLLPEPEPESRADFLKYSLDITFDPNTVNNELKLSDGNTKVSCLKKKQSYSDHPERFTDRSQVLGKESLIGRCYWEVECEGEAGVALAYKNISRAGNSDECKFGFNDKSWMLLRDGSSLNFCHNKKCSPVSGDVSSVVGVYLDHRAGILAFYSISETMTLLLRVKTTFTQPTYAGVRLLSYDSSAKFCRLKQT